MTAFDKNKLFISGLELTASIGVSSEERAATQSLLLDMTMTVDMRAAMLSDEIEHTVDYDVLSQLLKKWTLEKPYKLIESLGYELVTKTLLHFPSVQKVRLKLYKFPL